MPPTRGRLFSYCRTAWREAAAGDWLRSCHRQELPLLKASHTREESNFRNRFWRPVPEPLGHGHIGRNISLVRRPTSRLRGESGSRTHTPVRADCFRNSCRRQSAGLSKSRNAPHEYNATISGRYPTFSATGTPRYSAPVLTTRYLALHCDCGGRENRTPIAKGSRVTADAHSTCLPPDPDCGATRRSSTPSPYVADQIGKTKAAS